METEVNAILQTVNEGLKALPPLASDAFDVMVTGVRVEGIINLLLSIVGLVVIGFSTKYLIGLGKREDSYQIGTFDRTEMKPYIFCTIIVGLFVLVGIGIPVVTMIPSSLKAIIAPEYVIISNLFF